MIVSMYYYTIIIHLLETLGNTSEHKLSDRDKKALNDAKLRLETVLRLYYLRHGFENYDLVMVLFLSMVGFMQLDGLKSPDPEMDEGRRSTLVLSAKGLRDQGRNFYLSEVVFCMLEGAIGEENRRLLTEIAIVAEEDKERTVMISEYVQSAWPIDITSIVHDPEEKRLGNLVKAVEKTAI